MVAAAVCMANGNGATVVFGVADKVVGRKNAILGVPPEVDINTLLKAVFDRTAPTITPRFEDLPVPEGTGRPLLMHIHVTDSRRRNDWYAAKTRILSAARERLAHGQKGLSNFWPDFRLRQRRCKSLFVGRGQ